MAGFRSIVGQTRVIGPSRQYQIPISLDPQYYEGGIVYGSDGFMYHSNGTEWIKGETIVGSVTLIGSVPDVSIGPDEQTVLNNAFPGAAQNDAVVDEATNDLWAYDGTNWNNVGNIIGPTGPTGPQGVQGTQGADSIIPGPTGPLGPRGLQGIQGIQGLQGNQGLQGIQGNTGRSFTVIGSVTDVNGTYDGGASGPGDPQGLLNFEFPGATSGEGVIDEALGDLWVFSGPLWNNVGTIVGPQGLQGVQGTQGLLGIQGGQGTQGLTGQGIQGIQGLQGTQASQGIQGLRGNQGIQGTTGTSIDIVGTVPDVNIIGDPQATLNDYVTVTLGLPLAAGQSVINSLDGNIWVYDSTVWQDEGRIVGPQGTQGLQGLTGQGIQGSLGVQGAQGIQGLQGIQGTQGTSISILGSVANVNVVPPGDPQATINASFPGASNGDSIIDTAEGDLWVFDGFFWTNAGEVRGPQGTQGTQGTQGQQGIQGRQGTQGLQGIIGSVGALGPQGVQGSQGLVGNQGLQGISGFVGAQGPQGISGINGTQGIQGIAGSQGVQGIRGAQGIQGTLGAPGAETNIDTFNDTTSTTLYPVMVTGTGNQAARITTNGTLEFDATTGVLTTTASAAQYADLAERYEADIKMEPGTVVVFGGEKEITACRHNESPRVAGVISTKPALMMNCDAGNDITHPYVALKGRVPCKVIGPVKKGDVLVTSDQAGCAAVASQPHFVGAACIVGKALEDNADTGIKIVEIQV